MIGDDEMDGWLIVNPGVYLQLAKKSTSVESQFIVYGSARLNCPLMEIVKLTWHCPEKTSVGQEVPFYFK